MKKILLALVLLLVPFGAVANDTMVQLKTGGLEFVRTDAVSMVREDLFISLDEIKVDYIFENTTNEDVESLVAFPMPPLVSDPYEGSNIPNENNENFLNFRVFVEGQEIYPELSQRALALGIDVTDEIRAMGVPIIPVVQLTEESMAQLPPSVIADWQVRGLVFADYYDMGQGMEMHPYPIWTLEQVYYWRMVFPAKQQVRVSHTYTPSVGATTAVSFLNYDGTPTEIYDDYVKDYCIDPPFVNAVKKRLAASDTWYWESWITYILRTGANWYGTIGTFHLTVDKGSTDNLVSFCGTGVKKTAPTQFELTYKDYYPYRDLNLLFVRSSGS